MSDKKKSGKKKKKSHAKRRGALMVAKSGNKKKKSHAKRRSGLPSNLDGWKRAGVASVAMRLFSGLTSYFVRRQGYDFPKSKIIVPGVVAFAASKGMIPIDGIFPVAVDSFVNAVIDNTPTLRDVADFKFLDKGQPAKPDGRSGLGDMSVRQLADSRRFLVERNGLTYRQGVASDRILSMNRSGDDVGDGYRR